MLDKNSIMNRLRAMQMEELISIICESLDEAGISYQKGQGKIAYSGLLSFREDSSSLFSFNLGKKTEAPSFGGYQGCSEPTMHYAHTLYGSDRNALTASVLVSSTVAA